MPPATATSNAVTPSWTAPRRHRRMAAVAAVAIVAALLPLAGGAIPGLGALDTPAAASAVGNPPVMGTSRANATDLARWVRSRSGQPWRATVSPERLAEMYISEGQAEGVAGDLAFIQGVIETGWFGFSGRVPGTANNFAGIGATDSTRLYNVFRSARIGVRAQIQHLRAYADPTVTRANLAHRLESPRFDYVVPKGRAPRWGDMGNGNWATDPAYAGKILGLYSDLLTFSGQAGDGNPTGSLDAVRVGALGRVRVVGWAADPDTAGSIRVQAWVDGRLVRSFVAGGSRPDVPRALPQFGPNHGFSRVIQLGPGRQRLCVRAVNTGRGTQSTTLGCQTVTVDSVDPASRNPLGSIDRLNRLASGNVRVAGWSADPDTTRPIRVQVWVDGRLVRTFVALGPRPDVSRALSWAGTNHGFNRVVRISGAPAQVCLVAVNVGLGNANTPLGCRRV